MRLLLLVMLFATTCHAQLAGNPGVAKQFLSWDAAWKDSSSSTRKMLAWVPKARQGKWTASDKPFLTVRRDIDKAWGGNNRSKSFADSYQRRALDNPSALNNYAWGYSKLLLYRSGIGSWHQTLGAQSAMTNTYVPSTQYIRVLFLLSQSHWPTVREPVAQRLLGKLPRDNEIRAESANILGGIPTLAARRQAERLHKELLVALPSKDYTAYRLSLMGHFYNMWKRWNTQIGDKATSKSEKAKAKKLAVRDAKLAVSIWRKAMIIKPTSKWSKVQAPELIGSVNRWLAKNA